MYSYFRLSSDLDPMPDTSKLVISIGKDKFNVETSWDEDGFTVILEDGRKMKLKTDWNVGEPLMVAELNGQEISVQVFCLVNNPIYMYMQLSMSIVLSVHHLRVQFSPGCTAKKVFAVRLSRVLVTLNAMDM